MSKIKINKSRMERLEAEQSRLKQSTADISKIVWINVTFSTETGRDSLVSLTGEMSYSI